MRPRTFARLSALAVCAAALGLLNGCTQTKTPGPKTYVRVIDASSAAPNVDVYQSHNLIAQNLGLGGVTSYNSFKPGDLSFGVNQTATSNQITSVSGEFASSQQYTLLFSDLPTAESLTVITDQSTLPPSNFWAARFIPEASGAGAVDIYALANVTDNSPAGIQAAIDASTPVFTDVAEGAISQYLNLPAGNYVIAYTATGMTTPLAYTTLTSYVSGQANTFLLMPQPVSTLGTYQVVTATDLN